MRYITDFRIRSFHYIYNLHFFRNHLRNECKIINYFFRIEIFQKYFYECTINIFYKRNNQLNKVKVGIRLRILVSLIEVIVRPGAPPIRLSSEPDRTMAEHGRTYSKHVIGGKTTRRLHASVVYFNGFTCSFPS